jgi:hypothetical protein
MPDLAEAESLDTARRDFWQVRPDPLSHTAFARTLTIPDSEDEHGRQDPYDPRSHPGQWHFLQAIDGIVNGEPAPRRYRRFLLLTDAQGGGKSWLLQQIALHGTIELGQPVIWALPTKGLAGDMWNTKLRPAWEGSGLGVYLPTSGPGSRGSSAPRSIRTRRHEKRGGGTLVFMSSGGRGQAGQAGLTAKRLIVDELGDWSKAAFTRIRKRVSRFNDIAVEAYGSTLKLDHADLSQEIYRESARAWVEYRCPHCNEWTALDWKTWSGGQLACLSCGTVLTEANRRAMFAVSRIMMADPMNDVLGLRLTALDCPWKSLEWLASEEARATASAEGKAGPADHEPMRTFYHDERVEEYTGDQQTEGGTPAVHDARSLASRSSEAWTHVVADQDESGLWSRYRASEQPEGIIARVVPIDVQGNRLYWSALGAGPERRTYDLAWGTEYARRGVGSDKPPPWGPGDCTRTLQRIADASTELAGGPITMGIVDVSDGETLEEVYQFLSANRRTFRAIQGSKIKGLPAQRKDGTLQHLSPVLAWDATWRGIGSYIIDTDTAQQAVASAYLIDQDKPGAAIMPGPLRSNDAYVLHMTSTTWVTSKNMITSWKKIRDRNDFLDIRAYGTALLAVLTHRRTTTTPPRGKIGSFI